MKTLILVLSLFILNINLIAQNYPPRAGEFSSENIESLGKNNFIPSSILANTETFAIINFDSSQVSFKGNFPFADSYALEMSETDNLLFIGSGGGIYVTDISDRQNPVVLSEIRTRSLVDQCTYDPVNKRLYVCAYFSGIEIWDLNDLTSPFRMSRIPTEPYPRSGVVFINNYLIIATNNSLWSIDITDPYNPVIASELFISGALITQITLKENLLFLVSDSQGLKVIDVSNPLNMQLHTNTAYVSGSSFDISGDYLYAAKSGTFTILDISNPSSIGFSGALAIDGYPEDIKAIDNKVYISKFGTDGGLQIINVENPSSPAHISLYPGNYRLLTGADEYIYLTMNSQFSVLNVSDPLSVQYVTGFKLPGFVQDIAASGRYIYTGSNGFRVIDAFDQSNPVEIGYADINGLLVEAADDSIVIFCPASMTANNTIHVMDVSDPTNPASLDQITSPAMTWDLVLKDNLAIVACWWDGIRIFSFDDPQDFKFLSRTMGWQQGGVPGTEWFYAQAAAVEGDFLYVVDYGPFSNEDTYGLYIIDISNPAAPVVINRFVDMTCHPQDIKVQEGNAFIADGNGGLEIVNVTDPNNPYLVSYLTLGDAATGIAVDEGYAYISNYILGGVQVIEIVNPGTPVLAGWYKPSGCFALGVEVQNGDIFVSDGIAGMQIYRNLLIPMTSVDDDEITVTDFKLVNYPNPFNPSTIIAYTIPSDGDVSLIVYNTLGEETAVLVNEFKKAGNHKLNFNASGLSSGIYFYKIKTGSRILTGKMVLLR